MDAIILSIGTELTLGQTVDTNTAWLSQRLAEIGVPVRMHVTLPDELEPIRGEIERSAATADIVLITGGIGPTEDDLTRQALAAAMHVPLELRPEYVEQIRAFFAARNRPMPEANTVQAMFPAGSEAIANTCGTAPGIHARLEHAEIFVVPGVPREMKVMFERVLPLLSARAGGGVILATTLNCHGVGESDIGEKIRDLMRRGRNPTVGTTAQQSIIGVRIYANGRTRAEALVLLEESAAEVRRRLGPLVFGENEETLADAVGEMLRRQGLTLSTAESCTGGLLAKMITDIPGSSAYFISGVVTYTNAAKQVCLHVPPELISAHGAVSPQVAQAMAVNCRSGSDTDFAISITGIAGPDGGTPEKPVGLVYIGLADGERCDVTEHRFGETTSRHEIRERTCYAALNRLRLGLIEHPRHSGQC